MIRKQLYITSDQERALKERAREKGVPEAEIVREALNQYLRHDSEGYLPNDHRTLVEELVEGNKRLAGHLQFPKGYRFNREELYAEREERFFKKHSDV